MKRPKLEDYGDITYSQYMNDVDEYVNELQAEVADLEKENEQLEDLRVEYSELISELKKENEQLRGLLEKKISPDLKRKDMFKKIGSTFFDTMKEINPKGGVKIYMDMAVEYGYKQAEQLLADKKQDK